MNEKEFLKAFLKMYLDEPPGPDDATIEKFLTEHFETWHPAIFLEKSKVKEVLLKTVNY